jgi:hypothetical protein
MASRLARAAAFPGRIARWGDRVSDPPGRWRCAQIRANPSPEPNSREQGNFRVFRVSGGFHSHGMRARELGGTPNRATRDAISPHPNREPNREGSGNDQEGNRHSTFVVPAAFVGRRLH